jgi:uncharacterized protein (TIGR03435 family)
MRSLSTAILILAIPVVGLWADQSPSFEVASVKTISAREAVAAGIVAKPVQSGNRITWIATLNMMVRYAYDIRRFQLREDPRQKPLNGLYQILAKAERPPAAGELRLMFQQLLTDRFRLVVRRKSKTMPIYVLTIAPGGPKLAAPKERATPWIVNHLPVWDGSITNHASRDDPHHLAGKKVPLADLAEWFADALQTPVQDRTGLDGIYDLELTWNSFERGLEPPAVNTLSAAMRSQLGLQLDKVEGSVETITIEHVEVPTEN